MIINHANLDINKTINQVNKINQTNQKNQIDQNKNEDVLVVNQEKNLYTQEKIKSYSYNNKSLKKLIKWGAKSILKETLGIITKEALKSINKTLGYGAIKYLSKSIATSIAGVIDYKLRKLEGKTTRQALFETTTTSLASFIGS